MPSSAAQVLAKLAMESPGTCPVSHSRRQAGRLFLHVNGRWLLTTFQPHLCGGLSDGLHGTKCTQNFMRCGLSFLESVKRVAR